MARLERVAYAVVVGLGILCFFWGASTHARLVNREPGKDQGAYLVLGARMARTHALSIDGARPPLYPALLAVLKDPSATKREDFVKARTFTLRVTLAAWVAFLFVLRRWLAPWSALAAWLGLGLTLWLFYAPYVKAEALYYFFATASFALALDVLWRPRWRSAVALGVITGLGQLLKASLGPALGWFAAVQALAAAVELWRARALGRSLARPLRRVLTGAVAVAAFLVVVAPYLVACKAVFGRYFYNVNSDFYVWYDSWGETWRGTRGHHDRTGWPELPPEQIPSAARYLAEHSLRHIARRELRGALGLLEGMLRGYGFIWIALAAVGCGAVTLVRQRALWRWLRRRWPVTLFVLGYFPAYFALCAWFYAIHPGLRFVAALAPPAVFVGAWLSDRERAVGRWSTSKLFPLVVGGVLLIEAPFLVHWVQAFGGAGW